MGENRARARMCSADHHRRKAQTGIYVVSGRQVFVFIESGRERRIERSSPPSLQLPAHGQGRGGTRLTPTPLGKNRLTQPILLKFQNSVLYLFLGMIRSR
jgi:hypothetical protein